MVEEIVFAILEGTDPFAERGESTCFLRPWGWMLIYLKEATPVDFCEYRLLSVLQAAYRLFQYSLTVLQAGPQP